jgi:hypothetical protein
MYYVTGHLECHFRNKILDQKRTKCVIYKKKQVERKINEFNYKSDLENQCKKWEVMRLADLIGNIQKEIELKHIN